MNLDPHPASRFNQMLVVSVFFHGLLLTATLFLPRLEITPRRIQSAIQVRLVEIATGRVKPKPAPRVARTPPSARPAAPPETRPKAAPRALPAPQPRIQAKAKPVPVPDAKQKARLKEPEQIAALRPSPRIQAKAKPVPVPKAAPRVQPLPVPEAVPKVPMPDAKQKALLKELEQIAALRPTPRSAEPVAPQAPDSILEQRVRELEALKDTAPTVPIEPVLPVAPEAPRKKIPPKPPAVGEKEREFEQLIAAPQEAKPAAPPPAPRKLLEELETLSELQPTRPIVERLPSPAETAPAGETEPVSAGEVQRLEQQKEQLASLKSKDFKVDLEPAPAPRTPAFKSRIHSLKPPDPNKRYVQATVPSLKGQETAEARVEGRQAGQPGADVLALYIGEVERRVLSNWKSPFGTDHQEVQVSFYIYPAGKIDRPVLIRSSGNDMLDNLALRAISDSEPFPPFPRELKEPNLHITIHFHYVQTE